MGNGSDRIPLRRGYYYDNSGRVMLVINTLIVICCILMCDRRDPMFRAVE